MSPFFQPIDLPTLGVLTPGLLGTISQRSQTQKSLQICDPPHVSVPPSFLSFTIIRLVKRKTLQKTLQSLKLKERETLEFQLSRS